MKLINIALLSTALAFGIYTSSTPSFAADETSATSEEADVDQTPILIDDTDMFIDYIAEDVTSDDTDPVKTDDTSPDKDTASTDPVDDGATEIKDKETINTASGEDENGALFMTASGPKDDAPLPTERSVTILSSTTQDSPVSPTVNTASTDNTPTAPAKKLIQIADRSDETSASQGDDGGLFHKPKCKLGFVKCHFGGK